MIDLLPGGDILREGLKDLEAGRSSIPGLLVLTAAPRLARCGVAIPVAAQWPALPEHELYRMLRREHGAEAYRHYRSLMRRLVSLEQALELTTSR